MLSVASRHFDWLRQAEADLRLARHARDGAAHDWACFAAQQAAEKALKAVLMSRGADAWGHTVTALYEVTPVGSGAERIAPLRYGEEEAVPSAGRDDELATVAIRYKLPDADTSTELARHVTEADAVASAVNAPEDVRFAAAVAAFGQLLRGGRYTENYGYDDVIAAAQAARGEDPFGYRAEFLSLVRLAKSAAAMEPLRQ